MKKLFVLVAAIAAGVAAKAEENPYQYLYWQVDESKVSPLVESYDAARFYVLGQDGKVELSRAESEGPAGASGRWTSERIATDLGSYGASDSFVLELASWGGSSWETVGSSDVFTYGQLSEFLTAWQANASSVPSQKVWTPYVVPEPTSGLLMLLGIAGLALRRKRA